MKASVRCNQYIKVLTAANVCCHVISDCHFGVSNGLLIAMMLMSYSFETEYNAKYSNKWKYKHHPRLSADKRFDLIVLILPYILPFLHGKL